MITSWILFYIEQSSFCSLVEQLKFKQIAIRISIINNLAAFLQEYLFNEKTFTVIARSAIGLFGFVCATASYTVTERYNFQITDSRRLWQVHL